MASKCDTIEINKGINTVLLQFGVKAAKVPVGVREAAGMFVPKEKVAGKHVVDNLKDVNIEALVAGLKSSGFVLCDVHQRPGSGPDRRTVVLRFSLSETPKGDLPDVEALIKSAWAFVHVYDNPGDLLSITCVGMKPDRPKHFLGFDIGKLFDTFDENDVVEIPKSDGFVNNPKVEVTTPAVTG